MSKQIYFKELTALVQNKILEAFGATSAAELGLDSKPYATVVYDADGNVERVELFEPA